MLIFQAVLKDTTNRQNETKESINIIIQAKKTTQEKKNGKLTTLKEIRKDHIDVKPILKDPTESLGKLQLGDTTTYSEKSTCIINHTKLEEASKLILTPKLPDDIEDIDAGDNQSPLLMSTYIKDIYNYLTELEIKYPIEQDHLKNQVCVNFNITRV